MKKYLLFLFIPLFISCSSDNYDDRTVNEKLDDALTQLSGGRVYDYRNHSEITNDLKELDIYHQFESYHQNSIDSLNRIDPSNKEEYNKQLQNVKSNKNRLSRLENDYTIPSYSIEASFKSPNKLDSIRYYFNNDFVYLGNIKVSK